MRELEAKNGVRCIPVILHKLTEVFVSEIGASAPTPTPVFIINMLPLLIYTQNLQLFTLFTMTSVPL